MDLLFISVAFVSGLLVRQVGLPPLVGFLVAGFGLNLCGVEGGESLQDFGDFGVTLLLFTIGLKLKLQSLARPQVWGVATLHMLVTVLVFTLALLGLSALSLGLFAGLEPKVALILAFALSFSSTVFAVKALEECGELSSLHGRISIGILIMQDIFAVAFLVLSTGKVPSIWAFALLAGLFVARPVLSRLIERSGHGELLLLFGLLLTIAGASAFEAVRLKGDLGALMAGMLVAHHPKAGELADKLLSFKDLLLVGFFLNIGLTGVPTLSGLMAACILVLVLPLKVSLFFFLMTRMRLRGRTAFLGSLSLANYSEFGLIVGTVAVANGWLPADWLVTLAVGLSASFVLASPLNARGHTLYGRWSRLLVRFETPQRLPEDELIDCGDPEVVVVGMGRTGTAAYDALRQRYGDWVLGMDFNEAKVKTHSAAGRRVILGDATDVDFVARLEKTPGRRLRLLLLAMPNVEANLTATRLMTDRLRALGVADRVTLAAVALHDDDVTVLKEAGVGAAFNLYADAGAGFALHAIEHLESLPSGLTPRTTAG